MSSPVQKIINAYFFLPANRKLHLLFFLLGICKALDPQSADRGCKATVLQTVPLIWAIGYTLTGSSVNYLERSPAP